MRKKLKRALSLVMAMLMVLSATPLAGLVGIDLPDVFTTKAHAASYDRNAAVSYAAAHWDDGVGQCAQFVSACITAGGISVSQKVCLNLWNTLKSYGTPYKLTVASNDKIKLSSNSGKVEKGDPLFYVCETCGGTSGNSAFPHVVFCGGTDSSGYLTAYAHNVAWNNKTVYSTLKTSAHSGHKFSVYSIHLNGENYSPSFNVVFSSPDSGYANKSFVTNTNAGVVNKVTRTDGGKIDKVGIILYDYNDKQLAKKEESTSSTKVPFHLWYNINSSLGVTLTKGTLYKYKFYAVAGGKTFYSSLNTLVTTGNYTLSFNSDGGSSVSNKQVICGKTYGSLSTPTKTGYTFKGWYTSSSGGSQITSSTVCNTKSSHTIYAQWTPNKLSVYFNSNGGSVSSDTYTVKSSLICNKSDSSQYTQKWSYNNTKENGLLNASTFGLSKAGYTFAGWGTKSDGGTVFDQNDTSLKPTDINPDVANKSCSTTLYAIWKKITYTLSYDANGGSGVPSAQSGNTSYTISNTKPTKSGYTFLGWSTSSTATSASYKAGSTINISKNTTIYAVWKKDEVSHTHNYSIFSYNQLEHPHYAVFKCECGTEIVTEATGYSSFCTECNRTENPETNSFTAIIRKPSIITINYGDSIILHADVTGTLPEGAKIVWDTPSNDNFSYSVSSDGKTCKISPKSSGDTTFTVKIIAADGETVLAEDEQIMTSKAGFFQKLIAFFKKLFGLTKVIPQALKTNS